MSEAPSGAEAADGTPAAPVEGSPEASTGLSREEVFSWLGGPRATVEQAGIDLGYRGQRLGYPEAGPGSVASFNRRFVAVFVDWIAALIVARAIEAQLLDSTTATRALLPTLVFFLEITLLTVAGGASFGQRLFGIGVAQLDGSPLSLLRVALRTLLLCLAIPALIWDRDGRGLHDRAVGSVVRRR